MYGIEQNEPSWSVRDRAFIVEGRGGVGGFASSEMETDRTCLGCWDRAIKMRGLSTPLSASCFRSSTLDLGEGGM